MPRHACTEAPGIRSTALTTHHEPLAVMTDYKVELIDDNVSTFDVEFKGPADSESPWKGVIASVVTVVHSFIAMPV